MERRLAAVLIADAGRLCPLEPSRRGGKTARFQADLREVFEIFIIAHHSRLGPTGRVPQCGRCVAAPSRSSGSGQSVTPPLLRPHAMMTQAKRAILLAEAIAATLAGRRASKRASHGRWAVPCVSAYRITAWAPTVSNMRMLAMLGDAAKPFLAPAPRNNLEPLALNRHLPYAVHSAERIGCHQDARGGMNHERPGKAFSASSFTVHSGS